MCLVCLSLLPHFNQHRARKSSIWSKKGVAVAGMSVSALGTCTLPQSVWFRFRALLSLFQVQATSCDERFRPRRKRPPHDNVTMCVEDLYVDFQVGFSPGKEASERLRSTSDVFGLRSFLFVELILHSRFCTRAVSWQGLYFK